ncbi:MULTISPECIES: hypothetical protein [Nocardiopsis]|uniref:Secreted protein n=1 Tax=Nocardiopsis sinuspersici TaxID=501010 RepID=A0A1V3C673_9ACTN|nr:MULTISPECIES: hypothetical protein [Nocardiopsis]NYH52504.1 hypothetical protein [Nocardiopsis sinuspersici]OOC55979.1 hypothetical protein NOSIN_20840 [Nocardiopsis sinuspersici]
MSGFSGLKRVLATGAAAVVLGTVLTPVPASALVLDCDTFRHNNDPDVGIAFCVNRTDRAMKFRAVVVCGRAPDVNGHWVTLRPGRSGQSQGECAWFSSGVGAIGVDERTV